jgi:hypothetical protein
VVELHRFTDLRNLFGAYTIQSSPKTVDGKEVTTLIKEYTDCACEKSCLVFVDGKYRSDLSRTDDIDPNAIEFLYFNEGVDSGFNRGLPTGNLPDFLSDPQIIAPSPDVNVLARDSFGSDVLSALNMVLVLLSTTLFSLLTFLSVSFR